MTFEQTANEDLLNLHLANSGHNQTRLEIALDSLQDPGRLHCSGANLRPVPEQIRNRVALLFHFMQNYVFNYHSEMRLPEDKSSTKTERSYAIDQDIGEEGEQEGYNHEEEDHSESTVSDSVMTNWKV